MKTLLLVLGLTLAASPALLADDISKEDRAHALKYLEQTRDGVFAATKGLTPEQWNFKPGPDRWSVAEVTEHIAAAEDMLRERIEKTVLTAPPRKNADDVKKIDAFILKALPDRSHKAQAPEPLKPSNRFGSPQESLKHFRESRAKTITLLKRKDLRDHATESMFGQDLDAYEWILLIAGHSERHTKQIEEVKADPGFPKR